MRNKERERERKRERESGRRRERDQLAEQDAKGSVWGVRLELPGTKAIRESFVCCCRRGGTASELRVEKEKLK